MFGFGYKKDYEASVKELSAIELILCVINDELDDFNNEKAGKDEIQSDLLHLVTWELKNKSISSKRSIQLTHLITGVSKLLDKTTETTK